MRILVCPTAFKGSLDAAEATAAMARGVRRARPDARVREMPLSDGGPGLVDALVAAGRAISVDEVTVSGPLGEPTRGRILWSAREIVGGRRGGAEGADAPEAPARDDSEPPPVAVLESADACGLHLVAAGRRDALAAHTRGVGELIRAALARGAGHVLVGLGGSATTDGGTGMARVFGYRFLDEAGRELPPGGGALSRLGRIVPGEVPSTPVTALTDVETPLRGARGAARRFGPQKGATGEELERLVDGLERLSERLEADLGAAGVGDLPGSGAAGGLGAGLAAFLKAELVAGADWVLETVGFADAVRVADLLVTGEGAYDATSEEGKITGRVLAAARGAGVRVLLVCGRVSGEPPRGVSAVDGEGRHLEATDLATLVERAAAGEGGG